MAKPPIPQPLITTVPLTAEAREHLIDDLFAGELPNYGELFLPDDSFYISGSDQARAAHMVHTLCHWLGIKPGYIGLEFESTTQEVPDGRKYTIYVESEVLADEFMLGAFLACALSRYLTEERKQIFLPEVDARDALLATASIMFGLGLVIMNGLSPDYGWQDRFKHGSSLLKQFPVDNYSMMTLNFLGRHRINQVAYEHTLTHWAAKRLRLQIPKQRTHAGQAAWHRRRVNNTKLFGVAWLTVLVIGLGLFIVFERVKPVPQELATAEREVSFYQELTRLCQDALDYDRQYTDTSDIQATRVLNAEYLRCQSLENRYQAARQHLDTLNN